jgi:hypothetical protein
LPVVCAEAYGNEAVSGPPERGKIQMPIVMNREVTSMSIKVRRREKNPEQAVEY